MDISTEEWMNDILSLNDSNKQMTEKQQKIVLAAIEMFAEKGFAATSTSEIAQKAGVAEGTIFRHYKTKKDLLLKLVSPVMVKFIAPLLLKDFFAKVLSISFDNYEDFLRLLIKNRVEFAKQNMTLLKIMLQEIPFQPELQLLIKEQLADKVYTKMVSIVEHYQSQGQIIKLPSSSIIRVKICVVVGYIITSCIILPELDWDDEEEINTMIHILLHGLAAKTNSSSV